MKPCLAFLTQTISNAKKIYGSIYGLFKVINEHIVDTLCLTI